MYKLTEPTVGYPVGTELRDVTLKEARSMECNRCGGCCNGLLDDDIVAKDPDTGLPTFVWGDKFPEDLYAKRYGKPMLLPIVPAEEIHELPYQGSIVLGSEFATDINDKPYTCFSCTFHSMAGDKAVCELREKFGDGDPLKPETVRPLYCGEFPVFGPGVDDEIINGHAFIPPTGSLPKCTWHGIRVVGPWRDEPEWAERWDRQAEGLEVANLGIPREFVEGLEYKAKLRRESEDN